jgi:hypothetical protein
MTTVLIYPALTLTRCFLFSLRSFVTPISVCLLTIELYEAVPQPVSVILSLPHLFVYTPDVIHHVYCFLRYPYEFILSKYRIYSSYHIFHILSTFAICFDVFLPRMCVKTFLMNVLNHSNSLSNNELHRL